MVDSDRHPGGLSHRCRRQDQVRENNPADRSGGIADPSGAVHGQPRLDSRARSAQGDPVVDGPASPRYQRVSQGSWTDGGRRQAPPADRQPLHRGRRPRLGRPGHRGADQGHYG